MTNPTDALQSIDDERQAAAEARRAEILAMEAGPALDAEVDVRLFGKLGVMCSLPDCDDSHASPRYSTDAAAAMAVLNTCQEWEVRHHYDDTYTVTIQHDTNEYSAEGDAWPVLVCRAALLATLDRTP